MIAVGVLWVLIEAGAFNSWRAALLAEALTIQVGQRVEVEGDVRISIGLPTKITVTDVRIPSAEIPDLDLAKLDVLSLETNVPELLRGSLDFDRLNVNGLFVHLLGQGDRGGAPGREGRNEGSESAAKNTGTKSAGEWYGMASDLVRFVRLRSESFKSVRILFESEETGFTFDFNLDDLTFRRADDAQRLLVTSSGNVNGASFALSGHYAHVGPFSTDIAFADISVSFDGTSDLTDEGRSYEAQLTLETGQIGDLLEVLKLHRSLEGTGALNATVRRSGPVIDVSDATAELAFAVGPRITATGRIGDLMRLGDMAVETSVAFYPEDRTPPLAHELSEVRFLGVEASLLGTDGEVYVEDAIAYTNAFELELAELGPVSVGRVLRTEDGHLSLLDVSIEAGPVGAPLLRARGDIRDLLDGRDFGFDGILAASAGLLLSKLGKEDARPFGNIEADFRIDDNLGFPRLSELLVRSTGSDLWSLRASAQSGLAQDPKSFDVDVVLEVPDGAAFLGGLGLKEVAIAPLGLTMTGHADQTGLISDFDVTAGKSKLTTSLALNPRQDRMQLDGSVSSEEVRLGDLRRAIIGITELRGFASQRTTGNGGRAAVPAGIDVQPLVLPKIEVTLPYLLQQPDVRPLVLPRPEVTLESLLAEDGVQPLVLENRQASLKNFLDLRTLFLSTDVDIAIDIKRLSGVQGVTGLSSELVASGGRADLGPIRVRYGGGFVRADASMDLVNAPDRVRVRGSTGGWDIGKILEGIGQDVAANGIIEGSFDLTGSQKSIRQFAYTMHGSISLSMSQGSIATSLIELAGMGVLPWLFSQERRQRYTRIDCLAAPLRFAGGRVSLDNAVVETAKVQMVARGEANLRRDTVSIQAEPRPIGKPMARSPWPFTITGRLSKPTFKLLAGGARVRRADGASTMPDKRKSCVPDIFQLR